MTIDFRKVEVEINFDGEKKIVDVSKELANYCKQKTTDIGFEDFCREIYHKGEVEVTDEYKNAIISIISEKGCAFYEMVKRGIINALNQ
jgi:hypothetical protein